MGLSDMLLGWLYSAFRDYRRVRLTVHRAAFATTGEPAYFINVTNLSRDREIEITHVWLETDPPTHALPLQRPLPKRLRPDEVWETWVEEARVPVAWRGERAFSAGRVRLSTGRVVRSKENKGVPPFGVIPGGA